MMKAVKINYFKYYLMRPAGDLKVGAKTPWEISGSQLVNTQPCMMDISDSSEVECSKGYVTYIIAQSFEYLATILITSWVIITRLVDAINLAVEHIARRSS